MCAHARRMGQTKPPDVFPSVLHSTGRVRGNVARDQPMEPERPQLLAVESRPATDTPHERLHVASTQASLRRASLELQQAPVTQVDDVLA